MHGVMWEWCADRYGADYYFNSPRVDPKRPQLGPFRVLRGGSWFRYGKYARSAYRRFFHPESNSDAVTAWINDFGCRVVITPDQKKEAKDRTSQNKQTNEERLLPLAENLVKHTGNTVLDTGKKGDWDEKNCGCFSVAEVGGRLHLYYMGSGSKKPAMAARF